MREAELLILKPEDFKKSLVCEECGGRGEILDAPGNALDGPAYWEPCPSCQKYCVGTVTIEPLVTGAIPQGAPGMKRMPDIAIEGNFALDAEQEELDELDELFDRAKIGQVLNIVTRTRTLKFMLVQIDIP